MNAIHRWLHRMTFGILRRLRSVRLIIHDAYMRRQLQLSVARMYSNWGGLTAVQLMSVARHEAHRIEKAYYNNGLNIKSAYYLECRERLDKLLGLLVEKHGYSDSHPVIQWMRAILDSYEDFGVRFVGARKGPAPVYHQDRMPELLSLLRERRSCRVWAPEQPTKDECMAIAQSLIESARWAPCSGNRQSWRFKVIVDKEAKQLLHGLKEPHCLAAPLLIFIGIDRSVYGALGGRELGIFIDGGAVVEQMILAAHSLGLGTCWNHFAKDLIYARPANPPRYRRFVRAMNIPQHIEPIAILAVGYPEYNPPAPARLGVEELLL